MALIYTYPLKEQPVGEDLLVLSDSADNNKTKRITVDSIRTLTSGVTKIIAGTNITISPSSGTGDVTINASGGGSGGVTSFTNAFGTYITGTTNTSATGAVTMGTVDLNAVDGTSDTATRFLSKDNTWDVPSYTAAYSLPLATNGTRGGIQIGYVQNAKNYPVVLSSEKAYVNVPWTDNNTTYTLSAPNANIIRLNDGTVNDDVSLTAGTGISLSQSAVDNITFTNSDRGSSQNIFKNFTATTGGTATANSNNDTLTLAAGTGITTTRSGDTITIAATGSGGSSNGAILGTNIYHNDSTSPNLPAAFSFGNATTFNQVSYTTSVGAVTQNVGITINRPASGFVRIQVQCYILAADSNNVYLGLHHTVNNTIAGSAMQYGWLNPGHSADLAGQVYELNTYWDIDGRDFVEQGEEGPEQVLVGNPATFYLKGTATNSSTDMLFANRGTHAFTVGGVQAGWNGGLNLPTNTADCGGPCIITAYALESATRSVNPGTTP